MQTFTFPATCSSITTISKLAIATIGAPTFSLSGADRPNRSATRGEERELKEPRSLDASPRTERGVVRRLASDEDGLDAAAGEDRDDGSDIGGIVVEEMTDRETLELHGRLIAARPLELVRPERARDVGQDTGAITFAVDDTRSMRERSHTVEHELEDRARRPRVLARYRDQRTRIVLARHVSSRH